MALKLKLLLLLLAFCLIAKQSLSDTSIGLMDTRVSFSKSRTPLTKYLMRTSYTCCRRADAIFFLIRVRRTVRYELQFSNFVVTLTSSRYRRLFSRSHFRVGSRSLVYLGTISKLCLVYNIKCSKKDGYVFV